LIVTTMLCRLGSTSTLLVLLLVIADVVGVPDAGLTQGQGLLAIPDNGVLGQLVDDVLHGHQYNME